MPVWRILRDEFVLFGIVGRAIFRDPQPRDQEVVIAQHVDERDLTDDGFEKIGPLGESRADQ